MSNKSLDPLQIADIMENDPPDFKEWFRDPDDNIVVETSPGYVAAKRSWDLAISVVRTLSDWQFEDWEQLPEAKEPE